MSPPKMCNACHGAGSWETECCNGAYGCSCRGQVIDMGCCNVCGGTGYEPDDADYSANVAVIDGYHFIGSGPASGWDGALRMGRQP